MTATDSQAQPAALLEVRGLRKTFSSRRMFARAHEVCAARDVSFQLRRGEAVALVRAGVKPGAIHIHAETLRQGANTPLPATLVLRSVGPSRPLLYAPLPAAESVAKARRGSELELSRHRELSPRKCGRHRLRAVGRQQKDFA